MVGPFLAFRRTELPALIETHYTGEGKWSVLSFPKSKKLQNKPLLEGSAFGSRILRPAPCVAGSAAWVVITH